MSAGAWTEYSNGKLNIGNAVINLASDTIVLLLCTTAYVPNVDTHATYADVSGSEVAAGGGYTTGGVALSGQAWTFGLKSASVAAGGSGYAISSTFNVNVSGGTSSAAATANVTTNGSGVVTTVNSVTQGSYTVLPSSPAATTGGAGTGLTLNLVWEVCFSASTVTWAASTIAARYAVLVHRAGGSLVSGDKLLSYCDLSGGGNISSTNGNFTVTLTGSQIFTLS